MRQEIKVYQILYQQCPFITAQFGEQFQHGQHLCYSMELYDMTLYHLLKQTNGTGFPLPQVRHYAKAMGIWLQQMQLAQVIHTDMKPENMVLNRAAPLDVKLIDFGSAILTNEGARPTYIQSRFYRAPDITFQLPYSFSIDCWSVGALLVELHTNYTVFPARSTPMLVRMFVSLLGMPPDHIIATEESEFKIVRTKVQKYFVEASADYYRENYDQLYKIGLGEDERFYPSEEVLNSDSTRDQCNRRFLQEIVVNKQFLG